MIDNEYNEPRKSLVLFGLEDKLDFLINLYNQEKLPKVLMLSGKKGSGKFTLTNHLLNYIFDKENYNIVNKTIKKDTHFYKLYINNLFQNILYLSGTNLKNCIPISQNTLRKYIHSM